MFPRISRSVITQTRSLTMARQSLFRYRPWYFSDFFRPGAAWKDIPLSIPSHEGLVPRETWGNIGDEQLPEPWSCNWRKWGTTPNFLDYFGVKMRKPLAYRCTSGDNVSTAFLGVEKQIEGPRFYFYDAPRKDLFRFDHAVDAKDAATIGVAEFVNEVNWKKMTHLGSSLDQATVLSRHRNIPGPPLLLSDMNQRPWRVEPRGSFMAREEYFAVYDWCYIPELELPECWSCAWADSLWKYSSEQDTLRLRYSLRSPNPIMFYTLSPGSVLLESAGVFYLYGPSEHDELYGFYRATLGPSPPESLLYQFDGVYSSTADFLERGDWTKMSLVAPRRSDSPSIENDHPESVKLPMTDDGAPLRIAANLHQLNCDCKRTMWDMYRPPGTWGFTPRYIYSEGKRVPGEWD
ncbi:hypothetical protein B0H19DRAFT_1227114, partial [Mycena capillaripes]